MLKPTKGFRLQICRHTDVIRRTPDLTSQQTLTARMAKFYKTSQLAQGHLWEGVEWWWELFTQGSGRCETTALTEKTSWDEPHNGRIMYVEHRNQLNIFLLEIFIDVFVFLDLFMDAFKVLNHVHTKQTFISFFAFSFPRSVLSSKRGLG